MFAAANTANTTANTKKSSVFAVKHNTVKDYREMQTLQTQNTITKGKSELER